MAAGQTFLVIRVLKFTHPEPSRELDGLRFELCQSMTRKNQQPFPNFLYVFVARFDEAQNAWAVFLVVKGGVYLRREPRLWSCLFCEARKT